MFIKWRTFSIGSLLLIFSLNAMDDNQRLSNIQSAIGKMDIINFFKNLEQVELSWLKENEETLEAAIHNSELIYLMMGQKSWPNLTEQQKKQILPFTTMKMGIAALIGQLEQQKVQNEFDLLVQQKIDETFNN